MLKVFPWVAVSVIVLMCGAAVLGLIERDEVTRVQHVALSVFTLLLVCGVHTGVFTYFTVTGKLIQQAVALAGLDAGPVMAEVKRFKRRVTRCVGAAVAVIVPAVATGAWGLGIPATGRWHLAAAAPLIGVHVWAFAVYYHLIARNADLLTETMEEYTRRKQLGGATQRPSGAATKGR